MEKSLRTTLEISGGSFAIFLDGRWRWRCWRSR